MTEYDTLRSEAGLFHPLKKPLLGIYEDFWIVNHPQLFHWTLEYEAINAKMLKQ